MIPLKIIDLPPVSVRSYDRIMEKVLLPSRPESDDYNARPLWALWMLFLPSFSPEFAIGFEERGGGGNIWFRSTRMRLWSFKRGLPPREGMAALAAGLLPPRLWVSQQVLNAAEWSPVYSALAGTENRWKHQPACRLDGCSVTAWYWTDQRVYTLREHGPDPSVWSKNTTSLISDALSIAEPYIKGDGDAHRIFQAAMGCFS